MPRAGNEFDINQVPMATWHCDLVAAEYDRDEERGYAFGQLLRGVVSNGS